MHSVWSDFLEVWTNFSQMWYSDEVLWGLDAGKTEFSLVTKYANYNMDVSF